MSIYDSLNEEQKKRKSIYDGLGSAPTNELTLQQRAKLTTGLSSYLIPSALRKPTITKPEPKLTGLAPYVQGMRETVFNVGQATIDLFTDPKKALTQQLPSYLREKVEPTVQSWDIAKDAMDRMVMDYEKGTGSTAGDVANLAYLTSGVAGMLFSPVTTAFSIAEDVPGAKQVADTINVPFTWLGLAGAYSAGGYVEMLPISDESKTILKQPIQDLGSLALQVWYGGKLMRKAGDLLKGNKEITPELAKKIAVETKTEVQSGTPPTSPLIQRMEVEIKGGEEAVSQLRREASQYSSPELFVASTESLRTPRQLEIIWNDAQKLAPDSQFKSAVYERLKNEIPEQLREEVGYDRVTLKKDIDRAVEIIVNDRQKALNLAMNFEKSPNVLNTSVNIALAESALQSGNIRLYEQLTRVRSLEQTRRGQEIVAEKGSVQNNGFASYVKELTASRLEDAGKQYLSKLRIKKESPRERGQQRYEAELTKVREQVKTRKLDVKTAMALLDRMKC